MSIALLTILFVAIIYQDMRYRGVWWWVFPVSGVVAFWVSMSTRSLEYWGVETLINVIFVVTQFLIISLYFSLKFKQPTWIFDRLIGWGDVLFLLVLSILLSPINFVLFYFFSIVTILVVRLMWQKGLVRIPLAGAQASLFLLVLAGDLLLDTVSIASDVWILSCLNGL